MSATLTQSELLVGIGNALRAELAKTGEWLAAYDYGPPHDAGVGMRSYDAMFRTGPPQNGEAGPALNEDPPQLGA